MLEMVILDGGLGNNLFQLFYAWTLKRKSQSASVVLFAKSVRQGEEMKFLQSAANELGLSFTTEAETAGSKRMLLAHFKRKLSEKRLFQGWRNELSATVSPFGRLHCGYWQSIPFFPEVRNRFDDVVSSLVSDGRSDEPILHIRGGDYLSAKNAKIYTMLDREYYRGALLELKSRMSPAEYQIVSNDLQHAQSLLSAETGNFVSSSGLNALNDFSKISRHRVIVASNSTFCWWAARIGFYKGQTDLLIAPRHWMNEGYRHRSCPSYSSYNGKVVLRG